MYDSLEYLKNNPAVPLYDLIYQSLRQNIIRGVYKAGSRLTEEELSQAAGVSRTPIREALKRLAAEGFIEFIPKRGAVVMKINYDEIDILWDMRIFAEHKAAEFAARKANDNDKRRLNSIVEQMKKARIESNFDVADQLVNSLNSEIRDIADVNQLNRIYNTVDFFSHDIMAILKNRNYANKEEDFFTDHILITDTIIHNKPELAKELTIQHLLKWKEFYMNYFLENKSNPD